MSASARTQQAIAVVGEDQHGLGRGSVRGESAFKVEDAHIAGIGLTLSALIPFGGRVGSGHPWTPGQCAKTRMPAAFSAADDTRGLIWNGSGQSGSAWNIYLRGSVGRCLIRQARSLKWRNAGDGRAGIFQ
jgi:hypothetical protein